MIGGNEMCLWVERNWVNKKWWKRPQNPVHSVNTQMPDKEDNLAFAKVDMGWKTVEQVKESWVFRNRAQTIRQTNSLLDWSWIFRWPRRWEWKPGNRFKAYITVYDIQWTFSTNNRIHCFILSYCMISFISKTPTNTSNFRSKTCQHSLCQACKGCWGNHLCIV